MKYNFKPFSMFVWVGIGSRKDFYIFIECKKKEEMFQYSFFDTGTQVIFDMSETSLEVYFRQKAISLVVEKQ